MSSVPSTPHVLVVDDDPRVCRFFADLLERAGYAVETFGKLPGFFDNVSPQNLSCVLLDIRFTTDQDGTSLYREMLDRGWKVPVIFVSAFGTVPIAVSVVRAGALDVLSKSDVSADPAILLQAVQNAVVTAREWRKDELRKQHAKTLLKTLTPREVETVQWVLTGRLNKQIASELGITERTVIAHRMSVMKKIGVTSIVELIRFSEACDLQPAESPDAIS